MKSVQVKYQSANRITNSEENITSANNQLHKKYGIENKKEDLEFEITKLKKAIENLLLVLEK